LILQNLQNIGENLGPALAVAVVTFFYGFLFKALFMFAASKVEKYIISK
jgi:flagellar motor component MotA